MNTDKEIKTLIDALKANRPELLDALKVADKLKPQQSDNNNGKEK